MLSREQATPLIALVITLTVAHGLKLQLNNEFSLKNFNKSWMISVGGLLAGNLVNMFGTRKLLEKVVKDTRFVPSESEDSLSYILMQDILETVTMLLTAQVFTNIMNGESITISASVVRNIFLALSGILVYDIVARPLLASADLGTYAPYIQNVTKKTMSIAAADYMADLDFDNFGVEAGTTAAGIVIGDLSSTPVANQIFNSESPTSEGN